MTQLDGFADGLHCAPGSEFFRWLVTQLRDVLGVRYAFVGEFTGDDASRVRVLATSEDTTAIDHEPYEYDLADTAAAEPRDADGLNWYPVGVRARFPAAQIYESLGIEAVACLHLADDDGRPLGLLCALDTRPFTDPERVRGTLLALRARTTGDLALRRAQHERRLLTETAAAARTPDALAHLVEQLARALAVRTAFVSEVLDDPPTRARTIALWDDGRLVANIEYSLHGTPCGRVYERSMVLHPRDLQRLYPNDAYLAGIGAQAYLGLALHDGQGRPIGHVGLLHDHPLHDGLGSFPFFHVLALLASKEIERLRTRRDSGDRDAAAASGAAHDFNNLLAGIVAHSDLALGELPSPSPVRTRLEAIQLTAMRAADLARNMMDGQAAERGGDEAVALGPLARETVLLLGPTIPAHVQVEIDEEAGAPPVHGNPSQLRQIVMNLLLNAVEAIGDQPGRVTASIRLDRASAAFGLRPRAVLTVADTGIGMSAAARARIFEPAFTTKPRGRGIGLTVVRRLAERHGATIAVDSTPGAGSRFVLSFPSSATASEPAATRRDPIPALPMGARRAPRVLLVDDDEGVRVTTAHMLRRLGCEVVDADDGASAIAAAEVEGTSLDLVLLDLTMPGLSGEDVVRMLQRRWPALPVVVMSGYLPSDIERRLAHTLPLRFLQKPFGLDALRRCLTAVHESSVPPTAAAV
jgi:signal transduction histidine kinase/ActR/RegA family two-component response regulator